MNLDRGEDDDKHGFTHKIMNGNTDIKVTKKTLDEIKRKKMAMERDFYVHELLASIRPEEIPECKYKTKFSVIYYYRLQIKKACSFCQRLLQAKGLV